MQLDINDANLCNSFLYNNIFLNKTCNMMQNAILKNLNFVHFVFDSKTKMITTAGDTGASWTWMDDNNSG